jgi:hypothetical protein
MKMTEPLQSTFALLKVIKEGAPVVSIDNARVHALPEGRTKQDLPGPWETTSYTEYFHENSMLQDFFAMLGYDSSIADYAIEARWDYNGQYIADFRLNASGSVQVFSNLDVDCQTSEATYDENDVVELRYDIIITFSNLTSGNETLTIHALARGDGGGMSLG